MRHISLFSGIGGFDLAAEWAGWENVASCEIADFPRKVLQHYWPDAYHHDDIHTLNFQKLDYEISKKHGNLWQSDGLVLSGGFPCQPYSLAGKRQGKEDARHLWPEMLRVIREVRPRWVVGENVFGLVNWNGGLVFDEVQSDLEAAGYEVQPFVLPACGVDAPHRRDRVWFVAKNTNEDGWRGQHREKESGIRKLWNACSGNNERIQTNNSEVRFVAPDPSGTRREELHTSKEPDGKGHDSRFGYEDAPPNTECERREGADRSSEPKRFEQRTWDNWPSVEPTICRGDDGLSSKLDGITFPKWRNESIKAYGNAIVPQVAYQIFKAINEYERSQQGYPHNGHERK